LSALRVLIVDDEQPARNLLRELIAAHADVEVVGECQNGFEAVRAVAEHRPDLLLLDVQMPKLDGFEVLELLDPAPAVVFVTAHDEHALRAFAVHAVDYLLKPVDPRRLGAAIERARGRASSPVEAGALARSARPSGEWVERVVVRDGTAVTVIPVDRLDFVEAKDDYVAFHSEGKAHRKQQTMAEVETQLDPRRFVRIHRGYLLNLDRLARLETYAKDSRIAFLRDGKRLPVSRAGYERLKALL
jgi:two-component system LytT family response regulator